MANFIPSKKEATDFNKGVAYVGENKALGIEGDRVQSETINNLVEGLLYAQENSGSGASGLFEIPYDLRLLQSNSEGVDFIINNIEKIKKGSYFETTGGTSVLIELVSADNTSISLVFKDSVINIGDQETTNTVSIDKSTKNIDIYKDVISGGNFTENEQIMVGKFTDRGSYIGSNYNLEANQENDGKVIGVKDGREFAMVPNGFPFFRYQHNIVWQFSTTAQSGDIHFQVYLPTRDKLTNYSDLQTALNKLYNDESVSLNASGILVTASFDNSPYLVQYFTPKELTFYGFRVDKGIPKTYAIDTSKNNSIGDTVVDGLTGKVL